MQCVFQAATIPNVQVSTFPREPKPKMNIVIFGTGGQARVSLDMFDIEQKYNVVGLIDNGSIDNLINGIPVIGPVNKLNELSSEYGFKHGLICIGDNFTRQQVHQKIQSVFPSFGYVSAIHPDSTISPSVDIGCGSVIMAGVVINTNTKIGRHCIINTSSSIDHDGNLSDFSSIGPGVNLGGKVSIGELSHIGIGGVVKHGVSIGVNSIVGGLSFVNKDVGDNELGFSIPYRTVRKRVVGEKYL